MDDMQRTNTLSNLLEKLARHRVLLTALIVLVVVFIIIPMTKRKKPNTGKDTASLLGADDNRKTFERSDFISKKKNQPDQEADSRRMRLKGRMKERNYATEIAVFLHDEKKNKEPSFATHERKEPVTLGLPAGTKVPALIKDTIFSYNVESPVTAVVTSDFPSAEDVKIPKDSTFLGEAGVLKSLNRINVRFDLLIFPDGSEHKVRALALSENGAGGIKGRVSKHRDLRVLKAVGETALAGVSLFAGGVNRSPYSLEDNLRQNLSQNLVNEARQDLRSVKVDSSITVEGFTPIQVILLDGA